MQQNATRRLKQGFNPIKLKVALIKQAFICFSSSFHIQQEKTHLCFSKNLL